MMHTPHLPLGTALPLHEDFFLGTRRDIYFDSAATSLKPRAVLEAMQAYYQGYCSNVGRANHLHAEEATLAYESVRSKTAQFLRCRTDEVIFTMNCTDAINLAAQALGLTPEDEVIVSELEHHSNLLPWRVRAAVRVVRSDASGQVDLDHLRTLLAARPARLVACTYVSNITGNVQPVAAVCALAHEFGAVCLIDAAQAVGHLAVDVSALGCDLLAFSGHKMFGPAGVGVLFVRRELQAGLQAGRTGGGMVNRVDHEDFEFHAGPMRFEAGTPNVEGVLGFGAALDYLQQLGQAAIEEQDRDLEAHFRRQVQDLEGLEFPFPWAAHHLPIFTFVPASGIDVAYVSRLLSDNHRIATNAGYQCNQPLYRARGIQGGIRVSMHVYNSRSDVDKLVQALRDIAPLLGGGARRPTLAAAPVEYHRGQ
jgi:cysteine desulfurase / selenocysteine lyase